MPIGWHFPFVRFLKLEPVQTVTFQIRGIYRRFLSGVGWHRPCHDCGQKEGMNPMKIEIPFLAALVLIGTSLLARMAAEGVEQALLSTVIEYGLKATRGK